ncbi:unnamed protein product [Xylocopa violacea]|uniref:Hydrocephalus-inducing protein n=1 Tax=Xylocopa violacea TaxID=135666 RepID=A0ABP1P2B4_XYLVO
MIKCEQEKKKQLKLRQQRMIGIIKRVMQEMNNGTRSLKKPKGGPSKKIKFEIAEQSLVEIFSTREEACKHSFKITPSVPKLTKHDNKIHSEFKFERTGRITAEKKDTVLETEEITSESVMLKGSESSIEQVFPEDTCFFAIPSIVTFNDFEANKSYSRKLLIRNKTAKWAYLRFHKVHTEVWEPGVVEIDVMDAAKVKPGLDASINVKFSAVHEEVVTADICFLTLNPEDRKTLRQFRVPVRCTPRSAMPVIDPVELRFPTAPIWKYKDQKLNERVLGIFNNGRKSFSIAIEERNDRDHCFLWHFDQGELQTVESSILEDEIEGTNVENTSEDISNTRESRRMYRIEVPPKFKCNLNVSFRPRYVGLHHEIMEVYFLTDNKVFGKQSVPIWTEVTGYQIHLDPPCVDLGVLMIDSDVCQQIFNIINTGSSNVEVLIKTPRCLGGQISVYPKSTIVQPGIPCKITVRLMPESNIIANAKRYYDPALNMLEFPIQVQILSEDPEKPPPLLAKILVTLTTCHGLIIEPTNVDLGQVYTHESVYTELTLTNRSLLTQTYAFPLLPSSTEIHPNHGVGAILPGETIKLYLIYSPCPTDISGNEIGATGLSGAQSFLVRVATLAELAGRKKRVELIKLKDHLNAQSTVRRNRGFPPVLSVNLKTAEFKRQKNDREGTDSENVTYDDSVAKENSLGGEEETSDVSIEELDYFDRRNETNVVKVNAYIVDTLCELSEQIIKLPATPCGSFAMASLYLNGTNMASYPHCTCGIIKYRNEEFTASFEFKSSSDTINIIPHSGTLNRNERIDVNFLFQPKLPKSMIFEEDLRLEMNAEEQKMKSGKDDQSPRKGAADKNEEVFDVDKLTRENSLLETFEPCVSTIFITCAIDIEMKNGLKRNELLFAELICPITRPEILLLNEDREIVFERTAIGTSARKFLFVKNISNRSVKVEVSLLNPSGPFFVPPGRSIETGSVLKLPVTYKPLQENEEEDEEHFDVLSSRTRTRWSVKVSGRGVIPSYVLKPRFRIARLEVADEKSVELKMSIQNTGSCLLVFHLSLVDVLEGEIARVQEEPRHESTDKKRKGKIDGDSSRKSSKAIEFDDNLRPAEELAIFGGNLKPSQDRSCFSFWNLDENMQLVIPEKKKVEFGVRFHTGAERNVSDPKERVETTARGKKKDRKGMRADELKTSNYCYVAVVKFVLGNSTPHEIVIICSTK